MKNFILKTIAVTAFAIAAFITSVNYTYATDKNFLKEAVNTVVQLNRNCSGVVVETPTLTDTVIATANHCVTDGASDKTPKAEATSDQSGYVTIDDMKDQKVITTNKYVFDVVIRDTSNDLALLKLRKEGLLLDTAKVGTEDPTESDKVFAIGYPLGLPRTITEGFYGGFMSLNKDMSFNEYGNGRPVYKASPAIYGGNSGGGLFIKDNDGLYKLVGITDAGFSSFFVEAFFNPQTPLNEMIKKGIKKIDDDKKDEAPVVLEDKRSQH